MKYYPKQSCCPCCHTVYPARDVRKLMWKKQTQCYHCHKELSVSRAGLWMLAAELLLLYALLNVIVLGAVRGVSFIGLFLINTVPALAAILLSPCYIELKKTAGTVKQAKKAKK